MGGFLGLEVVAAAIAKGVEVVKDAVTPEPDVTNPEVSDSRENKDN